MSNLNLDLCYMTATEAIAAFKKRALSPVELLKSIIARCEQLEPKVNAFTYTYFDRALQQAKAAEAEYARRSGEPRPLEGVPVAIKDFHPVKGEITTFGSKIYRDYRPDHSAPTVQRLLDAGAIMHCRTTTPEFAHAGVVGMMDLVASLEWVRDNIENFGGDPSKVMIFGQSGGGAKTSTMLAIPSARGLFHSAGIQSGSTIRSATREQATKSAELLLAKLGISKGNIGDIQKVPWQQILEAQTSLGGSAAFTPVVDGEILPHHPFDPAAPPESADVPVIISNTLEDAALRLTNFDLNEEGLRTMLNQRYGAKAEAILAMYRTRYPDKSPFLIQAQIATDSTARRSATLQAERKAAQGKAPAYMYLWAFASAGFGGKFGAVHGTDVSATFNNYRDGVGGTGSEEERALWSRFANTWVAMAKNANPNNSKIPNWPAYDANTRPTMIFDKEVRVENDPRSEIRKFWADMPSA